MNIMDYSLFLIIIRLPEPSQNCYFVRDDEYERVTGAQEHQELPKKEKFSKEEAEKNAKLLETIDDMIR